MNATATLPPEVAAYLDQVRAALADVPPEERDEMLADLQVSLLEGAADTAESPEARLGPPERFAQELRAAAGLELAAAPGRRRRLARLHALLSSERARAAKATALELEPAWWIVRGYVVACVFALVMGLNWSGSPLIPVRDAPAFGLLLIVAGVVASVWLGRRERRDELRGRRWIALNLAVAALSLPVAVHLLDPPVRYAEVYVGSGAEPVGGLAVDGEPVRNVYPYSRDGRLLLDVLLYDENGQPLNVGSRDRGQDPLRRYLLTERGRPLLNAFPIRYVEPGSAEVKNPLAAPTEVEIPEIATPPLKVRRPGSGDRGARRR